jgi:hypothetical protein
MAPFLPGKVASTGFVETTSSAVKHTTNASTTEALRRKAVLLIPISSLYNGAGEEGC